MYSKLGFFRFVANYGDPLWSLHSALGSIGGSELCGSLIVLPEGFNIGKSYRGTGICNHETAILADLQETARRCNVAFVVGLIIKEGNSPEPPYSSAYLVDGFRANLICHKGTPDGSGTAYTPCQI